MKNKILKNEIVEHSCNVLSYSKRVAEPFFETSTPYSGVFFELPLSTLLSIVVCDTR